MFLVMIILALLMPGCYHQKHKERAFDKGVPVEDAFIPLTLEEMRSLDGQGNPLLPASDNSLKMPSTLKKEKKAIHFANIQEQEARLFDIPTPLSTVPFDYQCEGDTCAFLYKNENSSLQEVASFYVIEMERMGWHLDVHFKGKKVFLLFDKPHRFCTIILAHMKPWGSPYIEIAVYTGKIKQ